MPEKDIFILREKGAENKCVRRSRQIYVRVGIVQPDSVQRFVYGENLSHSFVAKTSGKYCVYVQNDLNFIVNVDGGYRVK